MSYFFKFVTGGLLILATVFVISAQQIDPRPINNALAAAKSSGVDWSKPFSLTASGEIDRNGRLVGAKTKYSGTSGDAKSVAAARKLIEAVGSSGWLAYLASQGVDNFTATLKMTASGLSVQILSRQISEQRAQTLVSGLGFVVSSVASRSAGNAGMTDDEIRLVKGITSSASGKNVTIRFAIPAADVRRMMTR